MNDLQNAAHGDGAQCCVAPAGMAAARELCSQRRAAQGTPVRTGAGRSRSIETSLEKKSGPRNSDSTSRRAACCRWCGGLVREKIIGHRMRSVEPRLGPGDDVRDLPGMLALFHQPARQHGRGVFFQPLVEQGTDLLAEIGGMTQARQFIGLQRIARSGQKKLPRRLGLVAGHGILMRGQGFHSNTIVIPFKDNQVGNGCGKLWKTSARLGRDATRANSYRRPSLEYAPS
jgi:hypothetical protein